jgi:hypothetical protein
MFVPQARHVRPLRLIQLSNRVPERLAGHVRPNPIPQRLSPEPNISGPQASFQRGWLDMSGPRHGHVRVSDTPTARFPQGGYKSPPPHASLARLATHFIANSSMKSSQFQDLSHGDLSSPPWKS